MSFFFLRSFASGCMYTSCILCSFVFAAYLSEKKKNHTSALVKKVKKKFQLCYSNP